MVSDGSIKRKKVNVMYNAVIGYCDTNGFKAEIAKNGDIYVRE